MRGGLKLFQTLRAFWIYGRLEHVEARALRGAVQQCSEACENECRELILALRLQVWWRARFVASGV